MSPTELHTVAVFPDAVRAEAGLRALAAEGFALTSLSVVALASEVGDALVARVFGATPSPVDVRGLGPVCACGPAVAQLQGSDDALAARGVAATASRLGFQQHDGRIYERLTARGGVLVAVESSARASDALALLHAYGGGNAAIGAWAGRL